MVKHNAIARILRGKKRPSLVKSPNRRPTEKDSFVLIIQKREALSQGLSQDFVSLNPLTPRAALQPKALIPKPLDYQHALGSLLRDCTIV